MEQSPHEEARAFDPSLALDQPGLHRRAGHEKGPQLAFEEIPGAARSMAEKGAQGRALTAQEGRIRDHDEVLWVDEIPLGGEGELGEVGGGPDLAGVDPEAPEEAAVVGRERDETIPEEASQTLGLAVVELIRRRALPPLGGGGGSLHGEGGDSDREGV